MRQRTIKKTYLFEGKGLHTGKFAHMAVCPAPVNTGIRFQRTDLGDSAFIDAIAENVSSTSRSTTIAKGKASVGTIEHILSALTGLGVDNALIQIDGPEAPIMDGSARIFAEAICADGLEEQQEERHWIELKEEVELTDEKTGSYIRIIPDDNLSYETTIDFNSQVLGVQEFKWDFQNDYVKEVAPCRTFCFFHEILKLATWGLVKGGSLDNAIVIVEKPVTERQLRKVARCFKQEVTTVSDDGYLGNIQLHFPDECCRHKALDLIGDLRLAGGFLKARVVAYKPGHKINTAMAVKLKKTLE